MNWIQIAVLGASLVAATTLAVAIWVVARASVRRNDQLVRQTATELQRVERRLKALEAAAFNSATTPKASDLEACQRSATARPDRPVAQKSACLPEREMLQQSAAPLPARPTWESFCDDAGRALESASAFVSFAERYRIGRGYALDAGGTAPTPVSGSADRADIYVLVVGDARAVFPAFNLRRGQGLLTSDAGRAAEARLGWLFDIVPGPDLRAIQPAIIEQEGWAVRRKGRLSLPL